jgi:SpoVK/Ycf46/Vps4 family AAA+-type ATPase
MGIDLSKSVHDSLQRGLERAKGLRQESRPAAAAEAYEGCAALAERYASYAVTPAEKQRRMKLAAQYRREAESLRLAPAVEPAKPAPAVEGDDAGDEYASAAEALIEKTSITWVDVAGLGEVKDQIRLSYGFALAERPEGVRLAGGRNILLFGQPGTGKTLLAAAASNELEATFFNVKTSNMLSKYFGESTKLVEALYSAARRHAPAVVFFDEFDALSASRDSADSGGPERRLLATLLAELDGLAEKGRDTFILTLAATNLPWLLDAAILSRFDRRVYVPLPDAEVRRGILEIAIGRKGYSLSGGAEELVKRTDGHSGRRIAQLCEAAVQRMVMEQNPDLLRHVDAGRRAVEGYRLRVRPLTIGDFELAATVPQANDEQAARYRQWQQANA